MSKQYNLDTLREIDDLRSIWKNEAHDFTPWLAQEENIKLLSDAIGVDIIVTEVESPVGPFSVDIVGKEIGGDRIVVIENQLESTDHDHLGKAITYAAGKNADIIIYIDISLFGCSANLFYIRKSIVFLFQRVIWEKIRRRATKNGGFSR